VPPDVAWLGPLAGCGGWLGTEMDPPFCPFCVVEPPPVPLLAELPLLVPGLAELPLLVPGLAELPLLGEVVAWAG
jgi:hypothetical protein